MVTTSIQLQHRNAPTQAVRVTLGRPIKAAFALAPAASAFIGRNAQTESVRPAWGLAPGPTGEKLIILGGRSHFFLPPVQQ